MKLPSITNATLTKVEGKGFSPDYDRDATLGVAKWTGSEEVFWSESMAQQTSGDRNDKIVSGVNRSDVIIKRSLVVDAALVIDWRIDDTVTVTRNGATEIGIIQSVRRSEATGLASITRLILDDA